MQIKIITIPALDSEAFSVEMNTFLRSHKIIDIEKQFFSGTNGAYWSFCIRYFDSSQNRVQGQHGTTKRKKVDYKEVLDDATFAIFAKLRELRKTISQQEAIPAYAIFTDSELAEISKLENITLSNMKKVKGIGEKKIERYGKYFEELTQMTDEKRRKFNT